MNFFDEWFTTKEGSQWDKFWNKGEETENLEPMKEDWQMELGKKLSDLVNQYLPYYKPGADYGSLSKLMTPSTYEQQGLDYLQKYIGGNIGTTGVMKDAENVLSSTLKGEYDPFTSKYYESLRGNLENERKTSINELNQYLGKYGLGNSSYRAGRVEDIGQANYNKVSDVLAALQQVERQNQLNAVPTAMNFSNTTESQIQKKLSTIMDIGSLPRLLEGVGYQDFLRKQGEYGGMADLGNNLFQYNIPYGKKSLTYDTPSGLDTVLDYATQLAKIIGAVNGGAAQQQNWYTPTVGQTTGGLNTNSSQTQPSLSSITLKDMSPQEFNEYWQMYS